MAIGSWQLVQEPKKNPFRHRFARMNTDFKTTLATTPQGGPQGGASPLGGAPSSFVTRHVALSHRWVAFATSETPVDFKWSAEAYRNEKRGGLFCRRAQRDRLLTIGSFDYSMCVSSRKVRYRSSISSRVSFCMRSVPKASTAKEPITPP
jgi:hypothetical protein